MVIGICDDECKECERIRSFVEKLPEINEETDRIFIYEPDEFRQKLTDIGNAQGSSNGEPECNDNSKEDMYSWDIVIMDIEYKYKDYDGIVLTKSLNEKLSNCQVIYLTHILEFAPEVYDTDHCYFVMKNNMKEMLPRAFKKATDIYKMISMSKPLEIISEGHTVFIPQENIRYVEKAQRQTIIHTDRKEYSCYESISSLSKKFGENVVRCHGGYLVNLSHVTYLGGEKIVMDIPKVDIPIGKTYREQTKQAYLKYWMHRM